MIYQCSKSLLHYHRTAFWIFFIMKRVAVVYILEDLASIVMVRSCILSKGLKHAGLFIDVQIHVEIYTFSPDRRPKWGSVIKNACSLLHFRRYKNLAYITIDFRVLILTNAGPNQGIIMKLKEWK